MEADIKNIFKNLVCFRPETKFYVEYRFRLVEFVPIFCNKKNLAIVLLSNYVNWIECIL